MLTENELPTLAETLGLAKPRTPRAAEDSAHGERSLTKAPSGGDVRQWEALGMSRATWYRRGKPTTKPQRALTQRAMAESLGVSLRTIQRDDAIIKRKVVADIREARAEGREIDHAWVNERWASHKAAMLRGRETKAFATIEAGLEVVQRLEALKRGLS